MQSIEALVAVREKRGLEIEFFGAEEWLRRHWMGTWELSRLNPLNELNWGCGTWKRNWEKKI